MYSEAAAAQSTYSTQTDETQARLLPHSSPATPSPGSRRSSMAMSAPFMQAPPPGSSSSAFGASSLASYTDEMPVSKQATLNKYALPADPRAWASFSGPEPDDFMHDPERNIGDNGAVLSWRGFANVGCIALLVVGILTLFAGYPIISHYVDNDGGAITSSAGSLNLVTNKTGLIPSMKGKWKLIDDDTPPEAYTIPSYTESGKELQLVFSDEFNDAGRTFYPGDDPFWEAVDLYYWQTVDQEWYDPAAITTADGALEITFSSKETHNVSYQGGMMATWNNFCFTGGIVQAAVMLPGSPDIRGYWPAVWTMGNLGRVGYGATTDGLWPYTYDTCDYGTVKNQTIDGQPAGALIPGMGDPYNGDFFSFLPGQRLSRCTCSGDHPGPKHSDGTYVGRSAPEIDLFEATAGPNGGGSSQSLQAAPFNQGYFFLNGTGTYTIYDESVTEINTYHGGAYQEAISALSKGNQSCYELSEKCFQEFAIEYVPGTDETAYITWVGNGKPTWTLNSAALGADSRVSIGPKPVPEEPMYLIMNLGMSPSFQVPMANLPIPGKMRVDYIRVYQDPDNLNVGCDPKSRPTMDYIKRYEAAYTNPNYTQWADIGEKFPGNSFAGDC